jgi:hypothetical protein
LQDEIDKRSGFGSNVLRSVPVVSSLFESLTDDTARMDALNAKLKETAENIGLSEERMGLLKEALDQAFGKGNIVDGVEDVNGVLGNTNTTLDDMLAKLDPVRGAWKDYYDGVNEVAEAGGDQEKQAEVLILLWEKLQKTLESSKNTVGELSKEFQSFRSGLDPAYSAQLQYNNSMETLNKHLEKGSSLWLKLANVIKNDYNTALNAQLNERVDAGANAATGAVNMDYITRQNDSAPERKSAKSFENMARDFLDKMDKGVLGPSGAADLLVGLRSYADKLGSLGEGFDVEGMKGTVMQLTAMAKDMFGKPDYKDLTADELKRVFEEAQAKALEKEQAEVDAWKAEVESAQYLKKLAESQGLVETEATKAGADKPQTELQKFQDPDSKEDIDYKDLSSIDRLVVITEQWFDTFMQTMEWQSQDNESLTVLRQWAEKQSEDKKSIGTININVKTDKGTATGQVSGDTDFLKKLASTLSNVSSAV